jgi:hypothetical protein
LRHAHARVIAPAIASLAAAACVLQPDLDRYGYTACKKDADCTEQGWPCESGFCTPPPWWEGATYGQRRQLTFENRSDMLLPKGFPVRVPVGPDPRPLKPDDVRPTTRVVAWDRTLRTQVEVGATVDVLGASTFDLLFPLPEDLPVAGVVRTIWLYGAAAPSASARTDNRAAVYTVEDTFEADALDPVVWRMEGTASFAPGDGEVTIPTGGYLWTNAAVGATPGVALTVLFSVTPEATCEGLVMGLMDSATRGFGTPYAVVRATGMGTIVLEALRADDQQLEPALASPASLRSTTQRLDLLVSGSKVRATLDGLAMDTVELRTPITRPLRAHFFVEGGSCQLSLKQARVRPAFEPEPTIHPGKPATRPQE